MVDLPLYNRQKRKYQKAYSIVEILISLGIIAIILVLLFDSVIISLRLTIRSMQRNMVREELASITTSIERDVRNADFLVSCGGPSSSECTIMLKAEKIKWSTCGSDADKICKFEISVDESNNIQETLVFESNDNVSFSTLDFMSAFVGMGSSESTPTQESILLTIVASHKNEALNINNILRQEVVSTRNYDY